MNLIGILLLIFFWAGLSSADLLNSAIVPSPLEVLSALTVLFFDRAFYNDILATLIRCVVGISVATAIGIPMGLVLGYSLRLYSSLELLIDFLRSIPATALFPLAILIFGIGDWAKIGIVSFSCGLIMIIQTYYGVINVSKLRKDVLISMNATKLQIFRYLLLWEATPHIFSGLRVAASLSLALVIVTEMFIGTTTGLGKRIIDYQATYQLGALYGSIIVTGLIGYFLNKGFSTIESRIIHWRNR
uniref:NitT/TauT family transport system permease protein n=1 Tax=Candidatus Kentrum sp. UNK TaxID=2126344 RepID=A0A451A2X4_9GAMM|nr:MAG: NitT/TauT family transport system permease protein [Candidatus Kentron sp. UNK]VFK69233.1 MAG: NitT/TauT family transport system permease protein [Candidatus Kentron sp. UNK]